MSKIVTRGKLTLSNFATLRKPNIGRAIVLTGTGGGYRLLSPDNTMTFMEALASGFSDYIEFDVSAEIMKTTDEAISSNPSFAFKLEIEISAKLEDPIAFIRKFGPDTSIFEAFYRNWLTDIRQEISQFGPDGLGNVQQALAALQSSVASRQPLIHGVRILGFIVKPVGDEQYAREAIVARASMLLQNYGPEAVIALKEANPKYASALAGLLKGVRDIRDDRARFTDEEWNRSVARIAQLYEEGIIDREERKAFLQLEHLKGLAQLTDGKAAIPLAPVAQPHGLLPTTGAPQPPKQIPHSKE